ncbi:MAG: 3-phosphoshikimate 1-carboxyvinyltransferase [Promethearchaeota archaeon]
MTGSAPLKVFPVDSLHGRVEAPPSKSYSHRAFISGLLTRGRVVIGNPLVDGDLEVTLRTCQRFGLDVRRREGGTYELRGPDNLVPQDEPVDVKNSGTTVRITAALAALLPHPTTFTGTFFDRERPMEPLLEALNQLGVKCRQNIGSLTVFGGDLVAGDVEIRGDISSQFITGLLMVLPLARPGGGRVASKIRLTTPLKSAPYVEMTLRVLAEFGVEVSVGESPRGLPEYTVPAGQEYKPVQYQVPGDFSSAAFPLVAAAITEEPSSVTVGNLDLEDPQGDRKVLEVLEGVGVEVRGNLGAGEVTVESRGARKPLLPFNIDGSDTPDLVPIFSVLGTRCGGESTLYDIEHVRYKESDRISVMARELGRMGAVVEEGRDYLVVRGIPALRGALFDTAHDHRVAMACTVAALRASSPSTIPSPEIVKDSYPNFFEDLARLGARLGTTF